MEDDRYIRRSWQYLLISIICILYGLFHGYIAIYTNLALGITSTRNWIVIITSTLIVLLQVSSFLLFYTQTFKSVSKIKDGTLYWLPCKNTITAAVICLFIRDYYLIQILVFLLILITDFSCIRMHKVSVKMNTKPDYSVRTELVWPSIYIISICIIYGYLIVVGEKYGNNFSEMLPASIPPILLAAYAMVIYFIKDKEGTNKDRPHGIHIFAVSLLIILTIVSNTFQFSVLKYVNLLFWSIIVSANCAIFEAWAVTYRKKLLADKYENQKEAKRKHGRYVRSCNIAIVVFITLFPTINILLFANICPFYNVVFVVVDMIFFFIWLSMQTNNNWSEQTIRIAKIVASSSIMILLFVVEYLPKTTYTVFTNALVMFKGKQLLVSFMIFASTGAFAFIKKYFRGKSSKQTVSEVEKVRYPLFVKFQNIFSKNEYADTNNLPALLLSSSLLLLVFYFSVIIVMENEQLNVGYQLHLGLCSYASIILFLLIHKFIFFVIDKNRVLSELDIAPSDDNE